MRAVPAALILSALGVAAAPLAGSADTAVQAPEVTRRPGPPDGDFTIITARRAGDVAGGPIEPAAAGRIGKTVSFGQRLTWWDGTSCAKWSAAARDDRVLPLDDPNLSDTQVPPVDGPVSAGDRRLNAGWTIRCDGKPLGVLLQVDRRVLVIPSPSGITNLVLEKPLPPDEIRAFQKHLKGMKFYAGEPAAGWDDKSLGAVASYAEYRGAKARFARTAITENLLDGLQILASQTPSDDPDKWVELKTVINGRVTAHFWGEKVQLAPLTYGVKDLRFTFEGDPGVYPFKNSDGLYFSDWSFDIFSPDGDYVLLLQGRFGPYHLVPLTDLKAYLKGKKEPAHVIGKKPDEGGPAAVHSGARWRSPYELEYTLACCGTEETRVYNVKFPDYQPKTSPDTLTDYRPSLSGRVAALPAARPDNLKALIRQLKEWGRKSVKSPGAWEEGNVALGADPKQYVPSDAELMLGEICDRISRVVAATNPSELTSQMKRQNIKTNRIVCNSFTFRHVDVMGSGRFFYASPPRTAVIDIKAY